ncbi:MAG: hypothetical protein ACREPQ_10760 [Rhodanobacter sp.]
MDKSSLSGDMRAARTAFFSGSLSIGASDWNAAGMGLGRVLLATVMIGLGIRGF